MRTTIRNLAVLTCFAIAGCNSEKKQDVVVSPTVDETNPKPSASTEPASTTTTGQPAPLVSRGKPRGYKKVDVLAIGISKYASKRIESTAYADRDAKVIGDLLQSEYGYNVQSLIDKDATRSAILASVERLASAATDEDALIIYYAGHGQVIDLDSFGRMGFIIPYDADLDLRQSFDPGEWKKQAIAMTELTTVLNKSNARHAVIILDACASGFITKRGEVLQFNQTELLSRRSRIALAACGESEFAFPDHTLKLGVFTSSLTNTLKQNKVTSVTELLLEARNAVDTKLTEAKLPHMGQFSADEGEFVFISLAIAESSVKEALAEASKQAGLRHSRATQLSHLYELFDANSYLGSKDRVAVEKAWQMKAARFDDNAALGDPLAMFAKSLAAAKGLGVKEDPATAYRWARRAFDTGHAIAPSMLGYCLWKGIGVEKNSLAAEKLLTEGTASPPPMTAMIAADFLSEIKPSDSARIEDYYAIAEKAGIESASFRLIERRMSEAGADSEKLEKGLSRLKRFTDRKHAYGCWLAYRCYLSREKPMSKEDQTQAFGFLKIAAEEGLGSAHSALAREYFQENWLTGELGVKADLSQAYRWAEMASTNTSITQEELSDAVQIMGICLMSGRGTKQDVPKGLGYVRKSEGMHTKNSVSMTVWLLSKGVDYMQPHK